MKTILNFILTALLAWAMTTITPWWGIMIAALVISYIFPLKGAKAFTIPFVAIALLWAFQAYTLGAANEFTMANRIATLFSLENNGYLLMGITALVGGLAAAFAGLLGNQLRYVSNKK